MDPLLFDGSLSFSLPTDKMTEYSVTLTDENGIDLVFENIPISEFNDACSFYNLRRHGFINSRAVCRSVYSESAHRDTILYYG